jgi:DNA (cytosine-5)-methyltransferase 1
VARLKPRLLDLFCGAGGATMGYSRAGFEVVGVDIAPQPHYPFEFHQGDVMRYVFTDQGPKVDNGYMTINWTKFDAIHASPPCQAYSIAAKYTGKDYPDLLGPTRDLLEATGLPWVIENVAGAPMRADYQLCGCQFSLELRRVRLFETSWHGFEMMSPHQHPHPVPSVIGHGTPSWGREQLGYWMNRGELSQAIPPAYTEFIGRQLIDQLTNQRRPDMARINAHSTTAPRLGAYRDCDATDGGSE